MYVNMSTCAQKTATNNEYYPQKIRKRNNNCHKPHIVYSLLPENFSFATFYRNWKHNAKMDWIIEVHKNNSC